MRAAAAAGFTLVEAMIALAIVAVLATLALPSFGSRLAHHRLVAAADGLAQDLAEARFQAAQGGRAMHIVFSGVGADWCYAVARQSGCACGSPQPCLVKAVRSTDLPGVRLESTRDASFDSTGAEANGGGAEFVSSRGERLRVAVSPLGRSQICAPQGVAGQRPC